MQYSTLLVHVVVLQADGGNEGIVEGPCLGRSPPKWFMALQAGMYSIVQFNKVKLFYSALLCHDWRYSGTQVHSTCGNY